MSELKTAVEVAQALERGELVEKISKDVGGTPTLLEYDRWIWHPENWAYRVRPNRLEFLVNVQPDNTVSVFHTKESAKKFDNGNLSRVAVHMREVTND